MLSMRDRVGRFYLPSDDGYSLVVHTGMRGGLL